MASLLERLGSSNAAGLSRILRNLESETSLARRLEDTMDSWSDARVAEAFNQFRRESRDNDFNSDHHRDEVIRGAALGAQAVRRVMGFRLHDVQVRGAIATASGAIIEMQTGEGKTMVCGLAAIIRSVFDLSVHVATTNAYLAERDHETVKPIFDLIGASSKFIGPDSDPQTIRNAYRCDITYAPGYTFGFDYLKDQIKLREYEQLTLGRNVLESIHGERIEDQLAQSVHQTIIVDEADSVLIDESTTPLLLSGPAASENLCPEAYLYALESARALQPDEDYETDNETKNVKLTDSGLEKIHVHLRNFGKLRLLQPWPKYVENALYGDHFLIRDENYVVADDKIKLVDQNTGRIFEDRSLRAGLHQALEAKEGVTINPPNTTLARVTRQTFFQLYDRVCGMTGTATGSEEELTFFYQTPVVPIEPNIPNKRIELPDRYFGETASRIAAIANDVQSRIGAGQPILVGTRTIRESLLIETVLNHLGIPCHVLNGVQDDEEADIIARAGKPGSIVIATNMAGRGTDIKLSDEARAAGGLHVIGTQRHESRRVDRQLAGRSARQGDPGSCQFFVSADDPLLAENDPGLGSRIARSAGDSGETSTDYSDAIMRLQQTICSQQFLQRRKLVRQDSWMDQVREALAGS